MLCTNRTDYCKSCFFLRTGVDPYFYKGVGIWSVSPSSRNLVLRKVDTLTFVIFCRISWIIFIYFCNLRLCIDISKQDFNQIWLKVFKKYINRFLQPRRFFFFNVKSKRKKNIVVFYLSKVDLRSGSIIWFTRFTFLV